MILNCFYSLIGFTHKIMKIFSLHFLILWFQVHLW